MMANDGSTGTNSSAVAMAAAAAAVGLNNVTHFIAQQFAGEVSADVSQHIITATTALAPSASDGDTDESTIAALVAAGALALSSATTKMPRFDDVRPVTLSAEWSRMARLLMFSCLSVVGSIGNVFMVSSVMIEDHLKKAGTYSMLMMLFVRFGFFPQPVEHLKPHTHDFRNISPIRFSSPKFCLGMKFDSIFILMHSRFSHKIL